MKELFALKREDGSFYAGSSDGKSVFGSVPAKYHAEEEAEMRQQHLSNKGIETTIVRVPPG